MSADAGFAVREESGELRFRSLRLRDHSRNLRLRSQHSRARINRATEAMKNAAATLAPGPTDGAARMDRLVSAERDLESAIAECSAALAEVRCELDWRDNASATLVH